MENMLFEHKQLAASLSKANQHVSELNEELRFLKVEENVLAVDTDVRVAKTKNIETASDSVLNMLFERVSRNGPAKSLIKGADIFTDPNLHFTGVARKVLVNFSFYCGREKAELWPFDGVAKIRCIRRGKKSTRHAEVVLLESIILPFFSDPLAKSGTFYQAFFFLVC